MKRIISLIVLIAFVVTSIITPSYAETVLNLPQPGQMVQLSAPFSPVMLKGVTIHPENPLLFDFIVDNGEKKLNGQALTDETTRLVKYFLAGLAVPEKELWVNLSPAENDRIMADDLSHTDVGRDLLNQDYLLKQITSTLLYPESDLGRTFWNKVYEQAYEKFGTSDVPVDAFNKVWIMPDEATVYQNGNNAFVAGAHLKVMLESDYLAEKAQGTSHTAQVEAPGTQELSKQILREVVVPVLEREVNEGANFAQLRQVFNSLILAGWYKNALKQSLLNRVYANTNKVDGIDIAERDAKAKVYAQYLQAYQKGVYNYIKEEFDRNTNETVPRKYFSGGASFEAALHPKVTTGKAEASKLEGNRASLQSLRYKMRALSQGSSDAAMKTNILDAIGDAWRLAGEEQYSPYLIRMTAVMQRKGVLTIEDAPSQAAELLKTWNKQDVFLASEIYSLITRHGMSRQMALDKTSQLLSLQATEYEHLIAAALMATDRDLTAGNALHEASGITARTVSYPPDYRPGLIRALAAFLAADPSLAHKFKEMGETEWRQSEAYFLAERFSSYDGNTATQLIETAAILRSVNFSADEAVALSEIIYEKLSESGDIRPVAMSAAMEYAAESIIRKWSRTTSGGWFHFAGIPVGIATVLALKHYKLLSADDLFLKVLGTTVVIAGVLCVGLPVLASNFERIWRKNAIRRELGIMRTQSEAVLTPSDSAQNTILTAVNDTRELLRANDSQFGKSAVSVTKIMTALMLHAGTGEDMAKGWAINILRQMGSDAGREAAAEVFQVAMRKHGDYMTALELSGKWPQQPSLVAALAAVLPLKDWDAIRRAGELITGLKGVSSLSEDQLPGVVRAVGIFQETSATDDEAVGKALNLGGAVLQDDASIKDDGKAYSRRVEAAALFMDSGLEKKEAVELAQILDVLLQDVSENLRDVAVVHAAESIVAVVAKKKLSIEKVNTWVGRITSVAVLGAVVLIGGSYAGLFSHSMPIGDTTALTVGKYAAGLSVAGVVAYYLNIWRWTALFGEIKKLSVDHAQSSDRAQRPITDKRLTRSQLVARINDLNSAAAKKFHLLVNVSGILTMSGVASLVAILSKYRVTLPLVFTGGSGLVAFWTLWRGRALQRQINALQAQIDSGDYAPEIEDAAMTANPSDEQLTRKQLEDRIDQARFSQDLMGSWMINGYVISGAAVLASAVALVLKRGVTGPLILTGASGLVAYLAQWRRRALERQISAWQARIDSGDYAPEIVDAAMTAKEEEKYVTRKQLEDMIDHARFQQDSAVPLVWYGSIFSAMGVIFSIGEYFLVRGHLTGPLVLTSAGGLTAFLAKWRDLALERQIKAWQERIDSGDYASEGRQLRRSQLEALIVDAQIAQDNLEPIEMVSHGMAVLSAISALVAHLTKDKVPGPLFMTGAFGLTGLLLRWRRSVWQRRINGWKAQLESGNYAPEAIASLPAKNDRAMNVDDQDNLPTRSQLEKRIYRIRSRHDSLLFLENLSFSIGAGVTLGEIFLGGTLAQGDLTQPLQWTGISSLALYLTRWQDRAVERKVNELQAQIDSGNYAPEAVASEEEPTPALETSDAAMNATFDKGGIDLGQGNYLKVIATDAAGMPKFDPAQLEELQKDLRGIFPIPVGAPQPANVQLLLGLASGGESVS